jgi:pimeloyl-ACP methyl ester carboxylesterase
MPSFVSYDRAQLTYSVRGSGPPLVCLPGGPGNRSEYLEDLGGLDAHRTLVALEPRGDGYDQAAYRVDRVVEDVDALRRALDLDAMDLLGHSAGGTLAELYAARHPERIARLLLITPSLRPVAPAPIGVEEAMAARAAEPWYAQARAALEAWSRADADEDVERHRLAAAPMFYGRWDDRARAHAQANLRERSRAAHAGFYAAFAPDIGAVRAALGRVEAPVLVLAGALDPMPTSEAAHVLAGLFPHGVVVVQPGAGHFPWVDDPAAFAGAVTDFLATA